MSQSDDAKLIDDLRRLIAHLEEFGSRREKAVAEQLFDDACFYRDEIFRARKRIDELIPALLRLAEAGLRAEAEIQRLKRAIDECGGYCWNATNDAARQQGQGVCPKCGSADVEVTTLGSITGGDPNEWRCRACGATEPVEGGE